MRAVKVRGRVEPTRRSSGTRVRKVYGAREQKLAEFLGESHTQVQELLGLCKNWAYMYEQQSKQSERLALRVEAMEVSMLDYADCMDAWRPGNELPEKNKPVLASDGRISFIAYYGCKNDPGTAGESGPVDWWSQDPSVHTGEGGKVPIDVVAWREVPTPPDVYLLDE